jgi:hypothetical protein
VGVFFDESVCAFAVNAKEKAVTINNPIINFLPIINIILIFNSTCQN